MKKLATLICALLCVWTMIGCGKQSVSAQTSTPEALHYTTSDVKDAGLANLDPEGVLEKGLTRIPLAEMKSKIDVSTSKEGTRTIVRSLDTSILTISGDRYPAVLTAVYDGKEQESIGYVIDITDQTASGAATAFAVLRASCESDFGEPVAMMWSDFENAQVDFDERNIIAVYDDLSGEAAPRNMFMCLYQVTESQTMQAILEVDSGYAYMQITLSVPRK